jgi:hypothetical protein
MRRANDLQRIIGVPVSVLVAMLAGCGEGKTGGSSGVGGTTQGVGGTTGIGGTGDAGQGSGGVTGTGGSSAGSLTLGGASGSAAGGSRATGGAGSGGNPPGTGGKAAGGAGAIPGTGGVGGMATGGSPGTGGLGTGGANPRNGGSPGTGGLGTGGANPGNGGSVSTGGAATGGAQTATGGSGAQGCPDSSAYVGSNTWKQRLEVKAGADYCGGWNESRTLEQELAAKAKLHVAAGTYALPDTSGSYPFALPVCFEFPNGAAAPSFAGAGQITQTQSTSAPQVHYSDRIKQPLAPGSSTGWTFQGSLYLTSTVGTQPEPLVFDGSGLVVSNITSQVLQLCTSEVCTHAAADIGFDSCNPESYRLSRSTVTFAGGQVVFDVRIAALPGGISESPMLVLASGTLDSVAFEQRDYWKLVYAATHHQFTRSFAVLFDSPANEACGIKVTTLDPYNGSQLPQVHTIHCDLSHIAERSVTAAATQPP